MQTISDDGFVLVVAKPRSELRHRDAVEEIEAMVRLLKHPSVRHARVLIDLRECKSASREARQCFASESPKHVDRIAMLIDDGLSRVIANFFVGLTRPRVAIRIFTVEQLAKDWLKG